MPIHLFNPATPHDDPAVGYRDQISGMHCGRCPFVPRAWKVSGVGKATTGGRGSPGSGTFFITDFKGDGTTNGTSTANDATIGTTVSHSPDSDSWFQFLSIPIPPLAKITAATLTLTLIAAPQLSLDQLYKITGSPSSSQAEPTGAAWATLPRTTSQLTGTIPGTSLANQVFNFDVTAIVQEIVTGSWALGGSIMFFMDNNDSGVSGGSGVGWKALDSNAHLPFTSTSLSVTWTTVNTDLYIAQFMGDHVLQRSIEAFEDDLFQQCAWGTSIDLSPIGSPFTPGAINLVWTSVTGDGGGDQWFLQLNGLPGLGAAPPDVAWYKVNAFALGPPGPTPFNCLSQNTFWREDLLGAGNFPVPGLPDSLLVQPFWP